MVKGTINYLSAVENVCKKYNGEYKNCPLGNFQKIEDCCCPRLIEPRKYTVEKINQMVRAVKKFENMCKHIY